MLNSKQLLTNTMTMNNKRVSLSIILISLMSLTACKQLNQLTHSRADETICLKKHALSGQDFYASGSASSLEQAKLNARQDLVQQISSSVSSNIESLKTDNAGTIKHSASSQAKSVTALIPIDKHKVIDSCKSGNTYFSAITLSKANLVDTTSLRLKSQADDTSKVLSLIGKASQYQQYSKRKELENNLTFITTYINILNQYGQQPVDSHISQLASRLKSSISRYGKLIIGLYADSHLDSVKDTLEQALNKAKLDYKQGTKNTVAIISLKSRKTNQRVGNRHIVKLAGSLDITRSDTGKLIKRHELGQVVTTSTVSSTLALQNAELQLANRLRQHLNVSSKKIRKILGFE